MIKRPPFPTILNSSLLSDFRSCPQKAFLSSFQHWKPKTPSVHLHAGGAYAAALEAGRRAFYLEGKSEPEAEAVAMGQLIRSYGSFDCPPDSPKSLERMCGALEFYFSSYPMGRDKATPVTLPGGKRGIEFLFVEPLDIPHPETGEPLLYTGRMDMVVDFMGARFGLDDKTTSQLGASWPKQWDLRSQFSGYCWGAARNGIPLQGFLVRGVSILKTKYDTLQAITYRPQWMIDQWYEQTIRDVVRMVNCWDQGWWDYDLDSACSEYGGCQFRTICQTPAEGKINWLRTGFERRERDPVTRQEVLLLDDVQ